ncbi:hypothetical protein [Anatilimnocola floriformis]|uniref:hypothetical protein n=1 Tax=Anatilimnocola floriformis TaxID=2948575 RepID=UPI0020C4DA81|nr:hypothetical protein [Anatilimnocola floriformis]
MKELRSDAAIERLDSLVRRLRGHVCESFVILEELEHFRETQAALPSEHQQVHGRTFPGEASNGWIAAGF